MSGKQKKARRANNTRADNDIAHTLILLYRKQARDIDRLAFGPPVAYVYNPLVYAREPFERYLARYGNGTDKTVFLGMNPGPWGMIQTGIPFGEVDAVRSWLGITGKVRRPDRLHPKRPVEGFACARREVSGQRLWGLFRSRFTTPRKFFKRHLVINYCPLGFFNEQGTNLTPDKLPKRDREPLLRLCDDYLFRALAVLKPRFAVGIGRFAESRLGGVLGTETESGPKVPTLARVTVVGILHPSPASPAANKGWEAKVIRTLVEQGVWR
jgi:single-strand selective monofunctional uracil DNA glycosylase